MEADYTELRAGFAKTRQRFTELVADFQAEIDVHREHLGGILTVPSISGIGKTFDIFEIDTNKMLAAISYLERFHK